MERDTHTGPWEQQPVAEVERVVRNAPPTHLRRFDLVTLVLVWSAPLPGLVLSLEAGLTPLLLFGTGAFLLLDLLLLVGTAVLAQRLLGRRSILRAERGRIPRWYHAVALTWVFCVVAAPVVTGVEGLLLGQGFSAWRVTTVQDGSEVLLDPAIPGTLWTLALIARVLGPIVLLVIRSRELRVQRQARELLGQPVDARVDVGDGAALAAVWAAPVLAVAAHFVVVMGWGLLILMFASPLLVLAAAHGIWVFHSVFRAGSRVRARLGAVPRRYRHLAWGWATAVVLPALVFPEIGGECLPGPCPWVPGSALETVIRAPVPPEIVLGVLLVGPVAALVIQVVAHVLRHGHVRHGSRGDSQPTATVPEPTEPQTVHLPERDGGGAARST